MKSLAKQTAARAGIVVWMVLLALFCTGSAQAATYYVSNSGSDSNNGTSTSTPWQTVTKVNNFTFQPGDFVLFQDGGKWYGVLNPQCSGAAGNPITFSNYGSGNLPLFSGAVVLANSGFTNVSGTVWQINVATQINEVYVNKVALYPANPNANQQVASIPNSWYWSNGVLQINVSTNPNTDGNLYEGATLQSIISNGNNATTTFYNHLVFSNLSEEESGNLNAGYGVNIQNGTDITLTNIVSARCGKHNFGIINSTQVTLNNCQASYPMPGQQQDGGYSAYVSYGDNSTGLANQTSVYNNCTGDHMEDTTPNQQYQDTGYEFFTCHGANLGSVTLNNCDAYSSSGAGAGAHWTINNSESGAKIAIHGGYQYNNQLEMTGSSLLVDGLTMQGPGANATNDATTTIDMECSNSTVQNVVMENVNVGYWLYSAAIQDGGNSNTIRFNTIVNDPNSSDASILNQNTTESLYGNIFINPGTAIAGKAPATNAYNLDYTSASSAGFINAGADNFGLVSTSPARDYVPLSYAYPSTDIVGTSRPDGSANDAGAYQYTNGQPPAPSITSATSAAATVGSPFKYQITASNNPTSYGESGTLPAGLTFTASTGVISGTPTATGTSNVTISATNATGTGSAGLAITVSNPTPPVITSSTTASGSVGYAFSYQITASGSPTSYSETGTLPAGLTLNISTGVISGTPSATGTTSVTIKATNLGGTGSATLIITVGNLPPTAYGVYALWTPGTTITNGGADSYGNGYNSSLVGSTLSYNGTTLTLGPANAPDAFSGVTVNLPAGSYTKLNMFATCVGGTLTNQTFVVTYTDGTTQSFMQSLSDWGGSENYAGETVVNNQPTRLASDGSTQQDPSFIFGYTFTLNGKSVQSITLPNTRQVIAFGFTSSGGGAPTPPAITSATTASGTVGTAFSYTITASNSPTSYNATGLPAGLSVNTSTGVISGTPTAAGTSSVTISATNASGTGSATLTLTINSAAPVITSATSKSGTVGTAFSYTITATNSPTSYSETGTLPAGLSLNTSTGVISGTPTTAATTSITIKATNASGTGSAGLTITISSATATPVISSATTKSGTVGTAFSYTITASNSPTSYNATGLPAGLSVNTSTGVISGTPTTQGIYSVTISATNAGGTGSATLTITISSPATAYGVYALWTPGTAITNGGADSYGNGYNSSLVGTSVTYAGNTLTLGAPNTADAYSNQTVSLPAGTYTKLNMIGSAVGGTVTGLTFTVNYTDGSTQTFTQNASDWGSYQGYAGETVVNYQTMRLMTNGTTQSVPSYIYGYTFTLNGKSVKSITLPNTRQFIAFGFTTGTGSASAKPVITGSNTASGAVGSAFSYQISATNVPTSFGATGLPAGLSVNTSTGVISGTPTTQGVSSVTISATNSSGTGSATLTITVSSAATAYNVYALWTPGTAITNGGADSYGNGYNASLTGTSATYASKTFTYGPTNAADAWSNTTVNLPAGTYTSLYMIGTAVGGIVTGEVFTVNYTDGSTQTFTQNLSDWENPQGFQNETTVSSQANHLTTAGATTTPGTDVYGYTFALNGKSVKSITLPNTRQVIAFGFAHN